MKIQNAVIGLDLKQKYREHSPYSKLKQIYNKYHFTALNKNELPLKRNCHATKPALPQFTAESLKMLVAGNIRQQ